MIEVTVRTRNGAYPVLIGNGLLQGLPKLLTEHVAAERFAVISDDNVAPLYGEELLEATRAVGLGATRGWMQAQSPLYFRTAPY